MSSRYVRFGKNDRTEYMITHGWFWSSFFELRLARLILFIIRSIFTRRRDRLFPWQSLLVARVRIDWNFSFFFIESVLLVRFSVCVCVCVYVRDKCVCVWFHSVTKVSKNPSLLASLPGDARTTGEMAIGSMKSEVIFVEYYHYLVFLQCERGGSFFSRDTLNSPVIERFSKGGFASRDRQLRGERTRGFLSLSLSSLDHQGRGSCIVSMSPL